MLAQVEPDVLPVDTPDIVWAGFAPIMVLAGGAVLLVMLRSIV